MASSKEIVRNEQIPKQIRITSKTQLSNSLEKLGKPSFHFFWLVAAWLNVSIVGGGRLSAVSCKGNKGRFVVAGYWNQQKAKLKLPNTMPTPQVGPACMMGHGKGLPFWDFGAYSCWKRRCRSTRESVLVKIGSLVKVQTEELRPRPTWHASSNLQKKSWSWICQADWTAFMCVKCEKF